VLTDERFDVPPVKREVTVLEPPRQIAGATDDGGRDVSEILRAEDGRYLDTFGRGQYQGVTRDHWVEADLGEVDARHPLWLIARGWLHPSDSSVNVAMSQGSHPRPKWLSLEVPDGHGGWRTARPNLGFPAGRKKICLVNLTGVLRPGLPHRVRLRTNLEIYWDQMQVAYGAPSTPLRLQRLTPDAAELRYRGFSRVQQANLSSPELPEYGRLMSTSRIWSDLPGFYTRFGDVRALLAETDDRYVIMNAGDEMALRFRVPPPPPAGWVRDFILGGDGWIKDGDYNTSNSESVLPYPHHGRRSYEEGAPGRLEDDWEYRHHRQDWLTYQTRYVSPAPFEDALREGSSR
jgi:hypothetical protein